jgi:hypothetical protein
MPFAASEVPRVAFASLRALGAIARSGPLADSLRQMGVPRCAVRQLFSRSCATQVHPPPFNRPPLQPPPLTPPKFVAADLLVALNVSRAQRDAAVAALGSAPTAHFRAEVAFHFGATKIALLPRIAATAASIGDPSLAPAAIAAVDSILLAARTAQGMGGGLGRVKEGGGSLRGGGFVDEGGLQEDLLAFARELVDESVATARTDARLELAGEVAALVRKDAVVHALDALGTGGVEMAAAVRREVTARCSGRDDAAFVEVRVSLLTHFLSQ